MKKSKGQQLRKTLPLGDGLMKKSQRRSGQRVGREQESTLSHLQEGWENVPELQSDNKHTGSPGRLNK